MANTRPVVISKLIDENMENINANIQATRVLNAQILEQAWTINLKLTNDHPFNNIWNSINEKKQEMY